MNELSLDASSLQPNELEIVYAISRAIPGSGDPETVLDEIVRLGRTIFIFDNVVIYTCCGENGQLEPSYARAIGRGRTLEADLAWGEATAQQVYTTQAPVLRVEETGPLPAQRTDNRHSLGLPLHIDNQVQAALVFIRFGGPSFLPAQIHLAEYIATHVAQLLEHRRLLEQVADLEARRRLDSLQEDFISTITHELLTPLGFIKGYATTLLRQDAHWDAATQHEFLTIIDEETDRLHELIDNLLDSSRLQAGTLRMQFQPIRLDVLLREILLRFRTRHEGLVINLLIGTPGVLIQADPSRLVQVFDNILSNAVKYASGSAIDITLRLAESEVQIDITDYGPGLPEESLDSLFQRFYRGPQSSAVRGTGLGLYISRKLVQAHHGALTARSSPGQGLTVTISLPITI